MQKNFPTAFANLKMEITSYSIRIMIFHFRILADRFTPE